MDLEVVGVLQFFFVIVAFVIGGKNQDYDVDILVFSLSYIIHSFCQSKKRSTGFTTFFFEVI